MATVYHIEVDVGYFFISAAQNCKDVDFSNGINSVSLNKAVQATPYLTTSSIHYITVLTPHLQSAHPALMHLNIIRPQ